MDQIDYSKKALRTDLNEEQYLAAEQLFNNDPSFTLDTSNIRILHATLGMVTEAAEIADQVKRAVFYGKQFDITNLLEEIGDSDWYRNVLVDFAAIKLSKSREEINSIIAEANIAKLERRYPDKFSGDLALARNTDAEREILEENLSIGQDPKAYKDELKNDYNYEGLKGHNEIVQVVKGPGYSMKDEEVSPTLNYGLGLPGIKIEDE